MQSKAFVNILSYNFPSRSSEKAQFCVETHSLRPSYDPPIPLSGTTWKSHLRPSKVAPTTLESPCQELTYDPGSRTYDPTVAPTTLKSPCQELTYDPTVAPTTLKSPCQELTLQSCAYDPPIPLSEAYLQPWKSHLRPQSCAYDPPIPLSGAYLKPSKSHLRPSKVAPTTLGSNPLVRSLPTTLKVAPATLQSCAYDPPIPLSGSHNDPFRTLAAYRVNFQRAKGGRTLRGRKNSHNLALYGTHLVKTRGWLVWRFTCTGIKHHQAQSFHPKQSHKHHQLHWWS